MSLSEITNTELLRLLAIDAGNEGLWREFYTRFHKRLCFVICKTAKDYGFTGNAHVEDLVQEVYRLLIKNDCRALKKFEGKWERSIYKYLDLIAVRVVLRESEKNREILHTHWLFDASFHNQKSNLYEILKSNRADMYSSVKELKDEIEVCLHTILRNKRNKERSRLIFQCYLYEDWTPLMIKKRLFSTLSEKRISNVITEIKTDLKKCLRNKNERF